MAYSTVIGDSQPTAYEVVVGALPVSSTTLAKLADVDDPVNVTLLSGKKFGTMYTVEADTGVVDLVIASGSEPEDPWTKLSGTGAYATLTLSTASDVGTAADIATRLNIIEAAVNALTAGNTITPA